jgi:chloramphenicol-sensitive protein RarD
VARAGLGGGLYAVAAFLIWGLSPIYFKAVGHVPVLEVMAHRIVWSVLLLVAMVLAWRRWPVMRAALAEPRTRRLMAASTVLLTVNW